MVIPLTSSEIDQTLYREINYNFKCLTIFNARNVIVIAIELLICEYYIMNHYH